MRTTGIPLIPCTIATLAVGAVLVLSCSCNARRSPVLHDTAMANNAYSREFLPQLQLKPCANKVCPTAFLLEQKGKDLLKQKQYGEALASFVRARDIRQSELGPDHASTYVAWNYIAEAASKVGNVQLAAQARARKLALKETYMGIAAPDTLFQLRVNLQENLRARRYAEATVEFEQFQSRLLAAGLRRPLERAILTSWQATLAKETGKPYADQCQQALRDLRRLLKSHPTMLPSTRILVINALSNLADLFLALKQPANTEAALEPAIALGDTLDRHALPRFDLGGMCRLYVIALLQQQKFPEAAEMVLRKAAYLRAYHNQESNDENWARRLKTIATWLASQGRYLQARTVFDTALAAIADAGMNQEITQLVVEILIGKAQANLAAGRTEEAKAAWQAANALLSAVTDNATCRAASKLALELNKGPVKRTP